MQSQLTTSRVIVLGVATAIVGYAIYSYFGSSDKKDEKENETSQTKEIQEVEKQPKYPQLDKEKFTKLMNELFYRQAV